jgi:DNA segregation ATPase FtsK/SpoIIIE-like protein
MHPLKPEFDLPKLRRQLEDILAMVKADHNSAAFNRSADGEAALSMQHENDATAVEPDVALADECPEPEPACEPATSEIRRDERDPLYDDALVVVTEFGQASPAILQMWLSIDYHRATKLLSEFQADGLVSSKGRVRHKAYSLRRSEA